MPREQIITDEQRYQRFSEAHTAFNALSRDQGENWQARFGRRQAELVAQGKVSPKEQVAEREDALIQLALGFALDRMNVLTANWGSGKPNRGALRWEPPSDWCTRAGVPRPTDAIKLTSALRLLARQSGASACGVAATDPRWLYADTQRNHCAPEPSITQPIHVAPVEQPFEDETGLHFPASLCHTVVLAVPMDRQLLRTAPSLWAEAATSHGYSLAAGAALNVAEFLRTLGYQAIPSLNGTGLSIPAAVQAGLGGVGRNGLLLTPTHGPCVRLAKVYTDAPLRRATPLERGLAAYCATCQACARACPAQAIPYGDPTWSGHNECNNDGALKWYIDAKRCLKYWQAAGSSCSVCVAVCPFTQGRRWLGGLPQALIARTPRLNGAIAWLDQHLLNHGRRVSSDQITQHLFD